MMHVLAIVCIVVGVASVCISIVGGYFQKIMGDEILTSTYVYGVVGAIITVIGIMGV